MDEYADYAEFMLYAEAEHYRKMARQENGGEVGRTLVDDLIDRWTADE